MADAVFFFCGELCHRFAGELVGQKQRIVAEAALACGFKGNLALALAAHGHVPAVRETAADGRNESRGALVHRNIGQILEQELVVLLVVTVLARVSCGIHSRRAVECVNGKSRVVGDAGHAALFAAAVGF